MVGSLLIERCHDAARLNEIVNHPAVFESACGAVLPYPADVSVFLDPQNIVLEGEHGVGIFFPVRPHIYDVHVAILPSGRGQWCREAVTEAIDYVFCKMGAEGLIFRCPVGNLAVLALVRMLGACFVETTEPAWPTPEGLVPYHVFVMRRDMWQRARNGRRH